MVYMRIIHEVLHHLHDSFFRELDLKMAISIRAWIILVKFNLRTEVRGVPGQNHLTPKPKKHEKDVLKQEKDVLKQKKML